MKGPNGQEYNITTNYELEIPRWDSYALWKSLQQFVFWTLEYVVP